MNSLQISVQAFFQQIQNWNLTLLRQMKKLKNIKKSIKNKFKLNSIQIILTEIQSEQIRYKKIKNKYQNLLENNSNNLSYNEDQNLSNEILKLYSLNSKIFMEILQKISLLEQEQNSQNQLLKNYQLNQQKTTAKNSVQKTFLNQTFAYKSSKQQKKNVNKSLFQKRKESQIKKTQKSFQRNKGNSIIQTNLTSINFDSRKQNQSSYLNINLNNDKKKYKNLNFSHMNQEQGKDLWEIKLQLTQIKAMMKQMQNQIKYHQHQETNQQINKIQISNRKIASQIKSIKDQNKYILSKIEALKQQILQQKKNQVYLINKYDRKNNYSGLSYHQGIQDSRKTHGSHLQSLHQKSPKKQKTQEVTENVSDWVKIRI